jgi:hypothetical protein
MRTPFRLSLERFDHDLFDLLVRDLPRSAGPRFVPCGTSTLPLTVQFDVKYTNPVEKPPSLTSLTTPGSVACGTTVALTANVSDPDGDLLPLRWYVDDVLLSPTTTSIEVTQPHTFKAVARDARGATVSKTKAITCW